MRMVLVVLLLMTGGAAAAREPVGLQVFCLRGPTHAACERVSRDARADVSRALLDRVNRHVNETMSYRADARNTWSSGGAAGDCEDFALTKMQALRAAGVPAGAMSMAVVRTPRGEGHAVLVVNVRGARLVLDNARGDIRRLEDTGYRVVWVQD